MGSVVESVTDFAGDVLGTAGDIAGEAANFAGDLASNAGIDTAIYLATGNYPAAIGSLIDDEIGFNPGAFYDPTSGSFSFAPGEWDLQKGTSYPGQGIIEPVANALVQSLAQSATAQPQQTQQQYAELTNLGLQGLAKLQQMIQAGEFEKSPATTFFADRPIATDNIMSRYETAKANLGDILRPQGLIAPEGRLGIFENYFKQRGLI